MNGITKVIEMLQSGQMDKRLLDIYADEAKIDYQRKRYICAIKKYEMIFGTDEIEIYSAPGRSEIGGNHTDHQKGKVLVASVNVDAIAIVSKNKDNRVKVVSEGYDMIEVSSEDLEFKSEEAGTTLSLIKGVLYGVREKGYHIGGFNAYITSDVLIGAGLSSSAAFETVIGTILSGMYNDMKIPPVEIAMIGRYAENVFFGKPCGLMDQMASSVGNLVHIDFVDENNPVIEKVECDFGAFGYSLCITDTKSSHADCTPEYAAVPREMKAAAGVFGKDVLREVDKEELLANISEVRLKTGDRAAPRAIHFMMENCRVKKEMDALTSGDFKTFLENVKDSGDSSFKYLQNVYMNKDVEHQNVSVALALSDVILGENGVSRVHGGGFAGTIQAFVKNEAVPEYQEFMNRVFGVGACNVYMVRKYGGMKVF
ncbi:MAG: galactokinase [Lachnospiraceae bacterium]|nr:galactokinase [Lachnospiraceae bacterium]